MDQLRFHFTKWMLTLSVWRNDYNRHDVHTVRKQ